MNNKNYHHTQEPFFIPNPTKEQVSTKATESIITLRVPEAWEGAFACRLAGYFSVFYTDCKISATKLKYASQTLEVLPGEMFVNAKSILGILSLGVKAGNIVQIKVTSANAANRALSIQKDILQKNIPDLNSVQ